MIHPKNFPNVCDDSGRCLAPADPDEEGPDLLVVEAAAWDAEPLKRPRRPRGRRRSREAS